MHEYSKLTSSANARVRANNQLYLFKLTIADLMKRWRVPYAEVERLSELDYLSFSPQPELALEPAQEAELTFLLTLRRAGWGDDQMSAALSSLTRPYSYDAQRLLYDVSARRWVTRSPINERELTIEGRIQRAREDRDVSTLKEIAHEAMKALVGVTEECLEDKS